MTSKIKEVIDTLKQIEKANQFYWLKAFVSQKDITKAEAGLIARNLSL